MPIPLDLFPLSAEEKEAYNAICNHGLNLNDFLDHMTPETSHPETDWGAAVGEEVLNGQRERITPQTSTPDEEHTP